ncbi:MAG: 7-carboxy-7-deazaguanine synthase QueE [Marinilabiliaceae bacterium]|nr:7-carboxy-7-deazaguanine synthase QueE [Marinilabiliaceae bacterium]
MGKIVLVDEGVFPIVKDVNGKMLDEIPQTGWNISGTVQGEGKLAGVPSIFIRLASCNLRCVWALPNGKLCHCDTSYASFFPVNVNEWDINDVVSTVKENLGNIKHVVITGGEPMLQLNAIVELCAELKKNCGVHITLESNGTIYSAEVAQYIDLVSLSPKLQNSVPSDDKLKKLQLKESLSFKYHDNNRKRIDVIQSWISNCRKKGTDFQLKFVVANLFESNEIRNDYLNILKGWYPTDVLLMPLGTNVGEIAITTPVAIQMAIVNGWRYTPRVHIDVFGCKKGV